MTKSRVSAAKTPTESSLLDPIEPDPTNGRPAGTGGSGVVAALRQWIVEGRWAPGERLAELAVAEALGVSRTPVRLALRTLAQEGLLQSAGARGYAVRAFSGDDVRCAVEVRGVLEGLAARRMAERRPTDAERSVLLDCLADGERLVAKGHLVAEDIGAWGRMNARLHRTIVEGDPSRAIADAIARNDHLPFASAGSITLRLDALAREHEKLRLAQLQHRLVVDALLAGESARVEALMREHALIGVRYAEVFGLGPGGASA